MSGIGTDIGNLLGGSAAKTDRKNQLAGFGDLSNLFNFGMTQGKNSTAAASSELGQAGAYYSKLLSGDRAATLSAVAPTVNAATQQTDAAKRGIASSGTARGGGVNSATQTLEDQKRAQVDSAVNTAKTGAAQGATQVGGTMASQAANLLGVANSSATSLTSLAGDSRKESNALHQQSAASVGNLASDALDVMFGM